MNTSIELDALYTQLGSYLEGDPEFSGDGGDEFPPLSENYPRIDCADPRTFDQALRATLRIKTLALKVSYDSYVATYTKDQEKNIIKTTYATGPSATKTVNYTVSPPPSGVSASYFTPMDESHLLLAFLGHYGPTPEIGMTPLSGGVSFRPEDDADDSYCRTIVLTNAKPLTGLPYVFTADLNALFELPANDGQGSINSVYVYITGTKTEDGDSDQTVIPVTFLGNAFNGITAKNPQPADFDSGQHPDNTTTSNSTFYRATKLEVTPSEYWAYGGKVNPTSGAFNA